MVSNPSEVARIWCFDANPIHALFFTYVAFNLAFLVKPSRSTLRFKYALSIRLGRAGLRRAKQAGKRQATAAQVR